MRAEAGEAGCGFPRRGVEPAPPTTHRGRRLPEWGGVCRWNPSEQTCPPRVVSCPCFPGNSDSPRIYSADLFLPSRPVLPFACASSSRCSAPRGWKPRTSLSPFPCCFFENRLGMELKTRIPSIRSPSPTILILHFWSRAQKSLVFSRRPRGF